MVAPSPTPFTPSGLVVQGVHSKAVVSSGMSTGSGHAVLPHGGCQQLTGRAVVDVVLDEGLPEPLGEPAVGLALSDQRVDDDADVVDDHVLVDADLAGFGSTSTSQMWQPFGKFSFSVDQVPLASSPTPYLSVMPRG